MKICRYNETRLGIVDGDAVFDVTEVLSHLPAQQWPFPLGDALISNLDMLRPLITDRLHSASKIPLASVRLNCPVPNPSKIIGAPINYHAHENEIDAALAHGHVIKPIPEWGLFLKAATALSGASEPILQRFLEQRTDYEIEMVAVIGRRGNRISRQQALEHVAGYCIGLDITLRGPQFQCFRKSIDSYAVVGPWLVTADEIDDSAKLDLELSVNGERKQYSNTSRLIFDLSQLIELASSFYTLLPGDMIFTGTPGGVGPIRPGDQLSAAISGIGKMDVSVRAA
jgi:2-keto-4-pentenoate hydratase/2-oxohepta-3-ene-1,7-dioic acid hydratase in catechol pathway